MNYKGPLFSIITIVYNDAKNIEETILSVINQKFNDKEYIVIDGGSTDGTVDIIKKYSHRINIWVSEKDGGIYPAMNKGVSVASGKIINMINSGDYYENCNVLSDVASKFQEDSKIDFLIGLGKFINDDGSDVVLGGKIFTSSLKAGRKNNLCHQGFFYSKEIHSKIGLYNLKYKICADGLFMYTIYYSKEFKGYSYNKILAVRRREGASSSSESVLEYRKFYREIFGPSLLNELMIIKYYLKKTSFGRKIFDQYLSVSLKFMDNYSQ